MFSQLCQFFVAAVRNQVFFGIFFSLALFAKTLHAQTSFTFEEWVEKALKQDPSLESAQAKVEAAQAGHIQVRSEYFPKLSVDYNWQDNQSLEDPRLLSLGITQNLFRGFSDFHAHRQATLLQSAETLSLRHQRQLTIEMIGLALLDLTLAEEQSRVFSEYKKILAERATELRRRFQIGKSRNVDILQNKMNTLKVERLVFSNDQALSNAQLRIFELTGVQNASSQFNFTQIMDRLREYDLEKEDLSIQSAQLRNKALEASVDMARATYMPSINVFANYYPVTQKSWSKSRDHWFYGVQFKWNLFEGGFGAAGVKRARAVSAQSQAELKKLELGRDRSRSDLASQRRELEKQLMIAREATALATSALKLQERDFRLGLITVLDLNSSDQQYLDLKLESLRIEHSLARLLANSLPLGIQLGQNL